MEVYKSLIEWISKPTIFSEEDKGKFNAMRKPHLNPNEGRKTILPKE